MPKEGRLIGNWAPGLDGWKPRRQKVLELMTDMMKLRNKAFCWKAYFPEAEGWPEKILIARSGGELISNALVSLDDSFDEIRIYNYGKGFSIVIVYPDQVFRALFVPISLLAYQMVHEKEASCP